MGYLEILEAEEKYEKTVAELALVLKNDELATALKKKDAALLALVDAKIEKVEEDIAEADYQARKSEEY